MKFLQVASLSLLVETTLSIEHTAGVQASKTSLNRRKKNAIGTGMDLKGRKTGTRNRFKSKFNARDKSNFDLGVLQSKGNGGRPKFKANRALHAATEECEETINCENGYSNGETCADACEGKCCLGYQACDNFTGTVCKDGVSCNGQESCKRATIDYIHQGCNGKISCFEALIKKVQNGCRGDFACWGAGYYGNINEIVNSCQGIYACAFAGSGYTPYTGSIGTIRDSCGGYYACYDAGYMGNINEIVNSCQGKEACRSAGAGYTLYTGSIGTIRDSCGGDYACNDAGHMGNINEIVNSCQGKEACRSAGAGYSTGYDPNQYALYYTGSIGPIRDSCSDDYACYKAGYQGNITEIMSACNANGACKKAGSYGMEIPSGIDSCCNEVGECESVNETSLPDDCLKSKTAKSGKSGKTGKSSKASIVAAREQALHMSLSLGEEPSSMSFLFI